MKQPSNYQPGLPVIDPPGPMCSEEEHQEFLDDYGTLKDPISQRVVNQVRENLRSRREKAHPTPKLRSTPHRSSKVG
jgi:hypothetical protein